jgi:hypothetical protein
MNKKFFWITVATILVVIALFVIADYLYMKPGTVERVVEKAKQ